MRRPISFTSVSPDPVAKTEQVTQLVSKAAQQLYSHSQQKSSKVMFSFSTTKGNLKWPRAHLARTVARVGLMRKPASVNGGDYSDYCGDYDGGDHKVDCGWFYLAEWQMLRHRSCVLDIGRPACRPDHYDCGHNDYDDHDHSDHDEGHNNCMIFSLSDHHDGWWL